MDWKNRPKLKERPRPRLSLRDTAGALACVVTFAALMSCAIVYDQPRPVRGDPIEAARANDVLTATDITVHDGDTFRATIAGLDAPWSPIGVRVDGIDAPELKDKRPALRAKALDAKAGLAEILTDRRVTLSHVRRDKYFRLLAKVQADDIDVSAEMIKRGLAREYHGRGPKPW